MSGIIITTILLLVSIVIIILLFVKSSKKHSKESNRNLTAEFNKIVAEGSFTIDKKAHFGTRIIGVAKEGYLIWAEMKNEQLVAERIPLKVVKNCELTKSYYNQDESVKNRSTQTNDNLSFIRLCLTTESNSYYITFYSELEDGVFEMLHLQKLSEEWRDYINHSRKELKTIAV